MKPILTLLLLLTITVSYAFESPERKLKQMIPAYFQEFTARIQILGHESDSANWPKTRADIMKTYFSSDSVLIPNILVSEAAYYEKQGTTSIQKLLPELSKYFWRGFQFEIDPKNDTQVSVSLNGRQLLATLQLPVTIRGIAREGRKSQRIGEKMKVDLEGIWENEKISQLKIKGIHSTGEWLYGIPLTKIKIQELENQLINNIRLWLSSSPSDSLQKEVCKNLQKELGDDTIFFSRSDKVSVPVSIKECKRPDMSKMQLTDTLKIESFALEYITDFYKGANHVYIGKRTRIKKMKSGKDGAFIYEEEINNLTSVPDLIATSQLSSYKFTKLIIQL